MLLALDTSVGTSVALVDAAGDAVAERSIVDTMRHAEVIGQLIREVLDEAAVKPHELFGVAVGVGPGPFTGLRVGIAAARVFALGAGIAVVPVVSHDAIAWERWGEGDGPLLVVTDARRKELYWSRYSGRGHSGVPERIVGPGLARPEDVPDVVGEQRYDASSVSAAAVGAVAVRARAAGITTAGEPLYLRSPDVTLAAPKRVAS